MGKLQELNERFETAKKQMINDGKEALKEAFGEFFAAHPMVKAIVWCQYTPYFNDGDPCVFSVRDWELRLDRDALDDETRARMVAADESDDEYYVGKDYGHGELCDLPKLTGKYSWKITDDDYPERYRSMAKAYKDLRSACSKEVLLSVLGDHVLVIATRAGFDVSEYEHD